MGQPKLRLPWRRTPEPEVPPLGVAQMLAMVAVQIRQTPNMTNDQLLWQLSRAKEFLNWIDERGGWNDELRRHFYKMMQFYD